MKVGQTSVIYFLSTLLSSAIGFIATIYIARLIGADGYGIYALALAVLAWLRVAGDIGVSTAVTKRMSESEDPNQYFAAGALILAVVFTVTSLVVLLLED